MTELSRLLESIAPPSRGGEGAARRHLDSLTKPPGSLGRLEEIALRLAVLRGTAPEVTRPVIFTFAADHGVVAEGVSAYPQVVTAQMLENFARGGAAVNVLARQAGARVVVADFGVASPLGRSPGLVACPIGPGTANIAAGPAMTREQAIQAIGTGARLADEAIDAGADLLATGEMGIGNTTAASAITAAITGAAPEQVTGRGTGVDDATLARKIAVVGRALAVTLAPASRHALFASHRSAERGHARALEHLGLEPYLDLGLRLGEGTGAALFIHLARAAALVWSEMATFKAAGVSSSEAASTAPSEAEDRIAPTKPAREQQP